MKLKFISVIALAFAFTITACQSDQNSPANEQNSSEPQSQQQLPGQQPAPQIEVSDDELEKFANVSMAAQEIQMESQRNMLAIVEGQDLDVATYNQIAQARDNGQPDEDLNVSSEELDKFDAASEEIESIEQEVDEKMTEASEEEGLGMDRFMEINMALQQDQELQERVQRIMMEKQRQQQEEMIN